VAADQARAQPCRADSIGLLYDKVPTRLEAVLGKAYGHAEGEREQGVRC
jgi:hypothetical protein